MKAEEKAMSKELIIACVLVAVIVLCCLVSAGFNCLVRYVAFHDSEYVIELPNGFYLSQVHAGHVNLCTPNYKALLGPTIDGYCVDGQFVMGHDRDGCTCQGRRAGPNGFFLLDTESIYFNFGLSRQKWLKVLAAHGIKQEPKLQKPSLPPSR